MSKKKKTKTRNRNQNLNSKQIINRLPISLTQKNVENNSNKLKKKSDKYYIFCMSIIKPPKNFATS